MNKIIAFSLWGNNEKYLVGALENVKLAKQYFSDWTCYFYIDNTVPKEIVDELELHDNVKVILVTEKIYGAFWRFLDMVEGNIVLSRDTDSRLSSREKAIVDDWLNGKEKMCTIRDHINHYEFPVLAGMWGIKNGLPDTLFEKMKPYWNQNYYLADQIYLRDDVWPQMQTDCKVYGIKETMWMRETYKSIGKDFIGQAYEKDGTPIYEQALS